MPLGDSITNYCYPQDLSGTFTANARTNFTFVGTQTANQGNCGTPSASSVKTEGHGGYFVTYLTTNSPPQSGKGTLAELLTWAAEKPDVVLLEMGTNDVWSNIAPATITSAYGFVVDQFRAQNPGVIFFVAQITPMHPSATCCETGVETLNAQIPAWAATKTTAASPVYVVNVWAAVDQATYLPNSTYTADGVHPNPPAARQMADAWYAALIARGIP
jgi:lysophospholipase L1-like esterase